MITWDELRRYLNVLEFNGDDRLQDNVTIMRQDGEFMAESYGTMACPTPSDTDFTAYPDFKQEQVESWLDAGLDVVTIDANLAQQIENLINPPVVSLPLPWATPAPEPTTETIVTED
jgi:hypothetical protein